MKENIIAKNNETLKKHLMVGPRNGKLRKILRKCLRKMHQMQKSAPDAECQACCLHSLNLVICHSSKIQDAKNMIDT